MGLWLTGKLGRAWVSAWVGAWGGAWYGVWIGEVGFGPVEVWMVMVIRWSVWYLKAGFLFCLYMIAY